MVILTRLNNPPSIISNKNSTLSCHLKNCFKKTNQGVVSKCFPIKGTWLLGEMGLGQRNYRSIQEHFVVPENKVSKKLWGKSKGHKSQLEGAPNGQSWDNLSNKINDSTNPWNKYS